MKKALIFLLILFSISLTSCDKNPTEPATDFVYNETTGCYQHTNFDMMRLAYPIVEINGNTKILKFFSQRDDELILSIFESEILTKKVKINPNTENGYNELIKFKDIRYTFSFQSVMYYYPYDEISNDAFRKTLEYVK